MCLAPPQRATFRRLNFEKWSEAPIFQHFDLQTYKCDSGFLTYQLQKSGLGMVCFVHFTAAYHFLTAQLAKSAEPVVCWAFWIENAHLATAAWKYSFLLWRHGSAPAASASLLSDLPDAQIIGKTKYFTTFLKFCAPVVSFFWLCFSALLFIWPDFGWLYLPGLLFISPYCRKFDL